MCKLPPIVTFGLCLLLAGCQTPLFSNGLFSSLSPKKTLTSQQTSPSSGQSVSATKPRIGGRGWRNASTRNAGQEAQTQVAKLNNIGRLREFLAKGNDAMQKRLYDDARIQYETVLSIEPHHATAHHMLGRINDLSKNFAEAERHYLEALSANREDGYLLSDLGYSYLQQGRLDEARQYLTQAITREPNLEIAKVNLAAVYAYGGDQRGALAWLRQIRNEQEAQQILADITSKPAPWVMNGAAESLAKGPDKFTINQDGQVLDANGQPLTTFEQVREAMDEIRRTQQLARQASEQREEFLQDRRIQNAINEQRGFDARNGTATGDANLNRQMRDIEQASGTGDRRNLNSRPIFIGPPGGNNTTNPAGTSRRDYPQNQSAAPIRPVNPQGQVQQFQHGSQIGQNATQQDPYAHLLNPAGPTGFTQQGYPNQQVPQGSVPGTQSSTVPPQFPGETQPQFPNTRTVPQQLPQQQYQTQNVVPVQPPQSQAQPGSNVYPGTNPAFEWSDPNSGRTQPTPPQQFPQQPAANAVPRDQYGNPIQSYPQFDPKRNGQSAGIPQLNTPPVQSTTAPNPNYFGQSNLPQNSGSQSGAYLDGPRLLPARPLSAPINQAGQLPNGTGNFQPAQTAPPNQVQSANGWGIPQQQPIQQLGFDTQPSMARIDRGQRLPQYSEADRQAMQLGMAAGFGALSPLETSQAPTARQPFQNNAGQQLSYPNGVNPGGGPQQPASVAPTNSGFTNGQFPAANSGFSYDQNLNREYPGAIPADSNRLPGQANFQAPMRQIPGQSMAEQFGQDPQTAQSWPEMPASQANVTIPAAFSSSTQPTVQQSPTWQRPSTTGQPWQERNLVSPTTQPGFGQPHMTNPYLRQPEDGSGRQNDGQGVPTVSWGSR